MMASLRKIWQLGLVVSVLAVTVAGCRAAPHSAASPAKHRLGAHAGQRTSNQRTSDAPASRPSSLAGQRLFIAWGPLRPSAAAQWKSEGFTTAFKLIGDFAWDKVEPYPGHFDFRTWHHDEAILSADHLAAFPSLEFLNPPPWFIAEHPDSVVEYGATGTGQSVDHLAVHCVQCTRSNVPSISLAWLMEQAHEDTSAWSQFEGYVTASLQAMTSDPSVTGVAFPWLSFKKREAIGSWTAMETTPSTVVLGDFNPASLASWPGVEPPPATLGALEAGGARLEREWEAWTQRREGAAFVTIASLLHKLAPRLWISVDKFVWIRMSDTTMHPVLALADGTTGSAFADFLPYLQRFVDQTNDHMIVLDDDALMDSSKIANYALTQRLIAPLGLSFMGESQPGPAGIAGLLKSIETLRPDAIVFLPAPGAGGRWITSTPDAMKALCLVGSRYQSRTCASL